jgi:hypothetical protein
MEKVKTRRKEQNQPSPGDLKHEPIGRFRTLNEAIFELSIHSINPYSLIQDFLDPTESILPIIIETPAGYHCIDGWNLIEHAVASGQTTIRCHVSTIEEYSDTELAIRKVAIRTKPQGGTCTHAERTRNTRQLYEMLVKSTDDPVVFSHGGVRRGPEFTSQRETNIRILLAKRLGKALSTINKYLQHSEYLNREAMTALVADGVPKRYFEGIQKEKHALIEELKAAEKCENDIANAVSHLVLTNIKELQSPQTVEDVSSESPQTSQTPSSTREGANPSTPQTDQEFSPWKGNRPPHEPPVTEEHVCEGLKEIGLAIINAAEDKDLNIQDQLEIIKHQIIELSKLIQLLVHLSSITEAEKEGKV